MKKSALVLFVILLAVVLTGCMRASTETNKNDAVAAASPVKERVDPAAIEAEILKLEREWMDAPKTKNGDSVRKVVADDAVLVVLLRLELLCAKTVSSSCSSHRANHK